MDLTFKIPSFEYMVNSIIENIDDKPMIDILYEMYSNMTIHEFMENGFPLLQKHEVEIRNAMH